LILNTIFINQLRAKAGVIDTLSMTLADVFEKIPPGG
jgi:hypothetical protein